MEEMGDLRRQWPTSLLTGMTRRQTDLETLRRECKARFRSVQAGVCMHCGTNIRHVSNLDLGQLWWCPASWCTQWKGASQGCIDHIRVRHHVGVSVKTANLGKWFPPWTVTRASPPTWCSSVRTGSGWSTTTGCSVIVCCIVRCAGNLWQSCCSSPTGPKLPGRWPNVARTGELVPMSHRVDLFISYYAPSDGRRPSGPEICSGRDLHFFRRVVAAWITSWRSNRVISGSASASVVPVPVKPATAVVVATTVLSHSGSHTG